MRNLQFWIETNVLLILKDAPFDKRDTQLVATAGSCADCPKRTGHNKLLFGDDLGKQGDQCTDPRCYNAKLAAHVAKTVAAKPNLVQISTAYGGQKEGSPVLPRNKYTAIRDDKPQKKEDAQRPEFKVCKFAADAIITEGSDIGTMHKVCANPECPIHHASKQRPATDAAFKAEQEKRRSEEAIAQATGLRVLKATSDLNQKRISMEGQVIVDGNAGNVLSIQGGNGLVYDSLPDMEMWLRWASGDFSELDKLKAKEWRSNISNIDIASIADYWKSFCSQYLKGARSVDDVINILDTRIVNSASNSAQRSFLHFIYEFLDAPPAARFMSQTLFDAGLLPKIAAWAPYAASVGKLGMVLCSCLSLKFVTSRPTNLIDLQYLFYAPFTRVFVSGDKLHRQLWPATTTKATFVWGEDLKADLKKYAAARALASSSNAGNSEPYYRQFSPDSSVIARVRNQYIRFDPRDVPPPVGKTIADLEPHIQEHLRLAGEALDRARREGWKRKDRS